MMIELKSVTAIEEKEKKQQEQKKLLTGKYRKGLKLFALDPENRVVYEVEIHKEETYHFKSKKPTATRRATINPKHPAVWALNMKNAKRKLLRLL